MVDLITVSQFEASVSTVVHMLDTLYVREQGGDVEKDSRFTESELIRNVADAAAVDFAYDSPWDNAPFDVGTVREMLLSSIVDGSGTHDDAVSLFCDRMASFPKAQWWEDES